MIIHIDDWRFNCTENDILFIDLYLDNGQHSVLEVNPIRNPKLNVVQVPEMMVFGEMPGEHWDNPSCPCRWITRPPDAKCVWSRVEVPPALLKQIDEQLGVSSQAAPTE